MVVMLLKPWVPSGRLEASTNVNSGPAGLRAEAGFSAYAGPHGNRPPVVWVLSDNFGKHALLPAPMSRLAGWLAGWLACLWMVSGYRFEIA